MTWSVAALAAVVLWSAAGARALRAFQLRAGATARAMLALWTLATVTWLLACAVLLATLATRVMGPGVKAFVAACVDLFQAVHQNGAASGVAAAGLLGTAGLARLSWTAVRRRRTRRAQAREHGRALAAGGHRRTLHLDRVWLVEHPEPAAYCMPGRGLGIVVTRGALDRLTGPELRAVLAHERAHLRGHHHLLVTWTRLLDTAFPGVPLLRAAAREVPELVEWAADDRAAREAGPHALAHALGIMAASGARGPDPALSAAGACPVRRVRRQVQPPGPPAGWAAHAGAALVVVLPLALAVLATALNVVVPYCECVG
ncbi:M48 family metalloprotease [Nocardiopsis exhalans]|uniref:M48 family metalloprotease n=1 Tax=Nocardiopsis exhalans TaxID=163604 RepID=A0ABY5D8Q2_9ACTN|nr:M56 family metallopeptidase [Nocardiopsis exhalans]USY19613.1 M48 family metalloprotease [Nocardiopsis exhalans]